MAKGKLHGHTERKIMQVKTKTNNKKKKKDLTECQREILCVSYLGFPVLFVINQ